MNTAFLQITIFLSGLFFTAVSSAAPVWQWTEPAGTIVGTPNFMNSGQIFSLSPLYDEADKDQPVSWTELDEVDVSPHYMGIDFNNAATVSGVRFYSYQQGWGSNHITSYQVMGKPQGASDFVELVSARPTTGALPGWEEVFFAQGSYDSVRLYYTGVSFGSAPRVGELQFLTNVPIPAAIWLFGSALAGFNFFGRRRKIFHKR